MKETIVHLSPSNLNSWDELRNLSEDSPPWITPEGFKESILGVFKPSLKAEAGNAVHGFVFDGQKKHVGVYLDKNGYTQPCAFLVDDDFLQFRKMFPFGSGVPEVSKVLYLDTRIDGCRIRISQRVDYLSPNLITEMKTSSKPFRSKGTIVGFMESQQSFSYTLTWNIPIRFLFAEIAIKQDPDTGIHMISLRNADQATAYPCEDSNRRLLDCVSSLVPYLREDEEMWNRVTNRTIQDEF